MTQRVQPRHAAQTFRTRISQQVRANRRRLVAGVITGAGIAALFGAVPAGAATSHDPFGFLDSATAGPSGAITVQGWAADPDALTRPLTVVFTIDGGPVQQVVENVSRPDVAAAKKTGPVVGYSSVLHSVPGRHTVCAVATNVGAGASVPTDCTSVTVAAPSAAELVHYPTGRVDTAVVKGKVVTVAGWAIDPDVPTAPLHISATVDGSAIGLGAFSTVARPDVTKAMAVPPKALVTGPKQGYTFSLTLVNGLHSICVNANNLGLGGPNRIACFTRQIGPPKPTAAQIAAQSPVGALQVVQSLNSSTVSVRGWATDPNNKNWPLPVVGYVDGSAQGTFRANLSRPDLAGNPVAGSHAGFAFNLPVSTAAHIVCVWAVNVGVGVNKSLGCIGTSTAGANLATGPRPAPSATGLKVVAAAKKFLGGKYVWGAEDPKVGFDCSGLVQYTYRGVGVPTPRVAQDQFSAAHLITAGRAVPGDLVFYHDSEGSVYHVGIYVSPGLTYAAVDEAEGIKVQPIWDDTATYGSFTHR